MRVFRCDWVDVELSAEIESCRSEREAADVNPKIELVARPPTAEALKEIAADVHREAPFLFGASTGGADRAGTTPLWTTLVDGLVAEQLQHATDGDPVSDCPICVTPDCRQLPGIVIPPSGFGVDPQDLFPPSFAQ